MYIMYKIIIVECMIGYYGKDCLNQCSIICNVIIGCDKILGCCDGGCKLGWIGNICDQMISMYNFFFYFYLIMLLFYDFNYVV